MDLDANLHSTLKQVTLKVNASNKVAMPRAHVGLSICEVWKSYNQ